MHLGRRSLSFFVVFRLVSGFRAPVRRFVKGSSTRLEPAVNAVVDDEEFQNVMDLVYMADVTVGGTDYPVQLDTGSSDLWIRAMGGSLPNVTPTDLTYNITYTVGYAAGHIARSTVSFAGYTVQNQALLQVEDSQNAIFTFGATGILGLGMTSLSSIDGKVTESGGDWGHNFLYNAFSQNPSAPNYIAFLLERTTDKSNAYNGSFTIGELEPHPGTCIGSVLPAFSGSTFDVHAGDVFLRNLYNLFDFGDFDAAGNMGDPYVQLLSLTDITAANQEYHQVRGGTLAPYKSSVTGSSNAGRQDGSTSTTVSASQQLNDNVDKLLGYAPIALGILGLNALVLLAILVVATFFLCRRNKGKKSKNPGAGSIIPLSRTHSYQPVTSENPDPETPASIKKYSDDDYAVEDAEKTAVSRNSLYPDGPSTPSRGSFAVKGSHLSLASVSRAANVPLPPPSPTQESTLSAPLASPRSGSPLAHAGNELQAQQASQPIPRSKEYLMAMEARKGALANSDGRRNTYNEQSGDGQLLPPQPQRRFQGAVPESDGGRRATFHGANEGFGAGRSTIYFDAQDGTSGPGGHQRTGSSTSVARTGGPMGSPLRPTFNQAPSGLGPNGGGHLRNGSSSLAQMHARNGSMTSPGWRVAEEESDLTEQKDTLMHGGAVNVFGDQPPPRMPAASQNPSQRTSYAM
ncbi:hypothetical protein FRC02_000849 [Tulasnella sp. 418]|nr:hypothetical protein FRC02_000849 [Tulasnella sp. 418]